MYDAPAAFSYAFFFIDRAWGSQVFQDFLSLSFCAGLDQLASSPSSNGNYVECSVGRSAFAAGHMKANGWRSTELLASFASSWQSLSSMRTRFGSQTSFSNVDSYTHKVFYWCLEWIRYCCLVLIHYCANANIWLTFQMTREGSCDCSDIFHNVIILNNLQFYHRKVLSYIPLLNICFF